jgi:hypothetical protein
MTKRDISEAKNPDLPSSVAAMRRAAAAARQTAILTNTAIVVVQDDKVVRITADQLRQKAAGESAQ